MVKQKIASTKTTNTSNVITITHQKDKTIQKKKNIKQSKQGLTLYQCSQCSYSHYNEMGLTKHSKIHVNPVFCPIDGCNKVFSPSHSYQYKQHMTAHNGGLNIKCKFCDTLFRTLNSHTLHMKKKHKKQYELYMRNVNKYNKDCNVLQPQQIIKLTKECLHTYEKNIKMVIDKDDSKYDNDKYDKYDKDDNYDEELAMIEDNKYNVYNMYNEYNIHLLADVAINAI